MEQQQKKRDGPVRCVCEERRASEERRARGGAWVCTSSLRYVRVAVVRTLWVSTASYNAHSNTMCEMQLHRTSQYIGYVVTPGSSRGCKVEHKTKFEHAQSAIDRSTSQSFCIMMRGLQFTRRNYYYGSVGKCSWTTGCVWSRCFVWQLEHDSK